ncbi:hypothetical protein [Cupriavidus sp. CP313]
MLIKQETQHGIYEMSSAQTTQQQAVAITAANQSPVTAADVTACLNTIGKPRLDPYRLYFRCNTDAEVLGAYLWGQAIAASLTSLVSSYEIVLRNAVHREASLFSSRKQFDSHPWYDHTRQDALPTKGKSREKVTALLYDTPPGSPPIRKAVQPVPDQVVASLSFGFWPNFLEGLNARQQPRILTDVFPGHPHSNPKHWGQSSNVQVLIGELKLIQALRNHIAHYEPIWKPHRLTGSENHWSRSVQSIKNFHSKILDIMGWCCPATPLVYKASYGYRYFSRLCTTQAVQVFMNDPFQAIQIEPLQAIAVAAPAPVAAVPSAQPATKSQAGTV